MTENLEHLDPADAEALASGAIDAEDARPAEDPGDNPGVDEDRSVLFEDRRTGEDTPDYDDGLGVDEDLDPKNL